MLYTVKKIFYVVLIIYFGFEIYDYLLHPNIDKSANQLQKFYTHDYFNVHYNPRQVFDNRNISLVRQVFLVYDFDTLNPISRIGTHLHSNDVVSGFENFESFISYVIHHFDSKTTHVLVRISSPGGAAYKFEKLYSAIKRLKKYGFETTAFIDDICASGGYMIACAFDKIVATETSQIGSIGVTTSHINYKELLDILGIKEKTFGTGKYKGQNNFNGGNDIEKQYTLIEESLDYTLQMFLKIVSTRPNINLTHVKSAKMWYGQDAYKLNLIDEIGHIDDYLYELSQYETNRIYYVVTYKQKEEKQDIFSLFKFFSKSYLNVS
jgi:signal peptide peptidase SppA